MLWIVLGVVVVWLLALVFVVSLGAAAARGDRLRRLRRTDRLPVVRLARRRVPDAPAPSRFER